MRRNFALVLLATCLTVTGCAAVDTPGDAIVVPSDTPSLMTEPTPTRTASEPNGLAEDAPADEETEPPALPQPQPSETRGPNDVDPSDYTSQAIDGQNGTPLPGVSFRTEDGRTICGILTAGHIASQPGTVSCTIDSYRDVIPQPSDREPFVKSVMADPVTGSYFLYPDWFAQPAREIPVLANGKSIRFEGTLCSAASDGVTCKIWSTGRGFTLSPTAYKLF